MAREDLHFRLRIPEDLKARVESAAEMNQRSMTAEIVERLQWTFGPADEEMTALLSRAEAAERTIEEMREALVSLAKNLDDRERELAAAKQEDHQWPHVTLPPDLRDWTEMLPVEMLISLESEVQEFAERRLRQAAKSHGRTVENLMSMFNAMISDAAYEDQPRLMQELKDLLHRAGIDDETDSDDEK